MYRIVCSFLAVLALPLSVVATDAKSFAGIVSSASPEATRAGQQILEQGGNAIDAAVAVSLAVGVTEPAGSGIAGQTVMLVQPKSGDPFVIHGTTWSPANIPATVTKDQLRQGRTASTVPSTLKVLSLAHQRYGSGAIDWSDLVAPSIAYAEEGFVVGPFRQRAFRFYGDALKKQAEAKSIFIKPDGTDYQVGETFRQPILADTLRQIAEKGAEDFYTGDIARKIAADMAENGGWITYDDLANFPEPRIVTPLSGTYRGYEVLTLPPPFGGWVVLQILNGLETADQGHVDADDAARRIALLKAMAIGHGSRKHTPVPGFLEYEDDVKVKISKQEAARLLSLMEDRASGETTHFSVVDGDGNAVSVTQSIDSYFGSKVVHPELGFLYNNYMQSFRLVDDGSPYVLKAQEMPLSSMSSAILRKDGASVMVLGSPGSARIISAVAQVSSFWIDVEADIEKAVGAYRVHVVPDGKAYVEGPVVPADLLRGMAKYGFSLNRPAYGVSDSQYDPYFGGVHALAKEGETWAGAADPRRDGLVLTARK